MTRNGLQKWFDPKLPITWVLGVLGMVVIGLWSLYGTLKETERRSLDNEKAIVTMQAQQENSSREVRDVREKVIAIGGQLDTLGVKIDGLRTVLNIQNLKSEMAPR